MNEKELLLKNLSNDIVDEDKYQFGRTMPFGKYKGWHIYYMIMKHPRYSQWINDNTKFRLNETELWWLKEIVDLIRVDSLIGALGVAVSKYGEMPENIENPHLAVE